MERALFHAARGRGTTSPNPMVGAVVVSPDGIVVGQGYHARAGDAHAEVRALDMAGAQARGATLFCTLEPCCHTGRTPPCAPRVVEAGIARVVVAVEDPNPIVKGRGFAYLREHGVEVVVGPGAEAAVRLNQPFMTQMRIGRPFVVAKAAVSADGMIAARPGARTALTSAAANRHAHAFRAEVDAIGVGSGTVLVDDPELTARGAYRARPLLRVVFDRRLRTPPTARVLSTLAAGPVMIITSRAAYAQLDRREALVARGATLVVAPDASLASAIGLLTRHDVNSLLIEGGSALHAAAWDEGLIDFVRLYMTPHRLGVAGVPLVGGRHLNLEALVERRSRALGPDTLVEGYVHGPR